MSTGSWTHRMARPLVRPMIGTRIRPNHLTTLRLATGLAAGACIAVATPACMGWGGGLWLVSAFLDRADGELARLGKLSSPAGHRYDYYSDNLVNAAFFAAIGVGLRHSWLAGWAIPLGVIAATSYSIGNTLSERLEERSPPNTRAYAGRWGFDPDDALYLLAPMAWLGWLSPILVGSAIGTTLMMVITGLRLRRLPLEA